MASAARILVRGSARLSRSSLITSSPLTSPSSALRTGLVASPFSALGGVRGAALSTFARLPSPPAPMSPLSLVAESSMGSVVVPGSTGSTSLDLLAEDEDDDGM
eukprot:Phypoly_transcript_17541.p1 GENE.Phypoly_transcript_17541~~Phypoly_transcript_17541.p1  ORF type:complete len:104 (+),score=23.16 Phypoly_transcript_17541:59-370(+)